MIKPAIHTGKSTSAGQRRLALFPGRDGAPDVISVDATGGSSAHKPSSDCPTAAAVRLSPRLRGAMGVPRAWRPHGAEPRKACKAKRPRGVEVAELLRLTLEVGVAVLLV